MAMSDSFQPSGQERDKLIVNLDDQEITNITACLEAKMTNSMSGNQNREAQIRLVKGRILFLNVCHAELNAIVNADRNDFTDCTMYVTRIPCQECAKVIIQSNIKEVFYEPGKMDIVTVTMFEALNAEGFQLREFEATNPEHMIVID